VRPHISLGYKTPAPEAIVTGNKTKAVPGQLEISALLALYQDLFVLRIFLITASELLCFLATLPILSKI